MLMSHCEDLDDQEYTVSEDGRYDPPESDNISESLKDESIGLNFSQKAYFLLIVVLRNNLLYEKQKYAGDLK